MVGLNAISVVDAAQANVLGMMGREWRLREFGMPRIGEPGFSGNDKGTPRNPPGYNAHDELL
jgi:hypothetical protein